MTVLIIVGTIIAILSHTTNIFKFFSVKPDDLKRFVTIRGKTIAWSFYSIIAAVISIFFLFSVSVVVIGTPFSVGSLTFIILILWGLVAVWTPIALLLKSQTTNEIFLLISHILMILVVVGFWFFSWPNITKPIFVTVLLFIFLALYIISEIRKNRKQNALK